METTMQNQLLPSEQADAVLSRTEVSETLPMTEKREEVALSPEATALFALVKQKNHQRKQLSLAAFGSLISLTILILYLVMQIEKSLQDHLVLVLPLIVVFSALLTVVLTLLRKVNRSVGYDANEVARLGGANAVPFLLESLNLDATRRAREPIYEALGAVLPQLKASDSHLLRPPHRFILNNLLMLESETGFLYKPNLHCSLGVLKAYEQVGDERAFSAVTKVANLRPRNERQRQLKEAAEACLPHLKENILAYQAQQTLLRASSLSSSASDILLRPATSSTSTDPEQLLRASKPNIEANRETLT